MTNTVIVDDKKIDTKMRSIVKCTFTASCPAATVVHRPATEKVSGIYKSSDEVAWVKVAPIPRKGSVYGSLTSVINSTGVKIRDMGLPCKTGGTYIQSADIEEVISIFDEGQRELDRLIKVVLPAEWNDIVAKATKDMGELAKAIPIPTADVFGSKFGMDIIWEHSPQDIEGTVMKGVANEVAARIRAQSKKSTKDMFVTAHGAPIQEVITFLTDTIEQLSGGKRLGQKRFDNAAKAAKKLAKKNLLNLPEIDKVIQAMASIGSTNRDDIVTDSDKEKVIKKVKHATKVALTAKADLGL